MLSLLANIQKILYCTTTNTATMDAHMHTIIVAVRQHSPVQEMGEFVGVKYTQKRFENV